MALLHWLPLNGDAKDYGLTPLPVTAGQLLFAEGKTGKAACFQGDGRQTLFIRDAAQPAAFTWCAWVCADPGVPETAGKKYLLSFGRNAGQAGISLFLRENSFQPVLELLYEEEGALQQWTQTFDCDLSGGWTHIALTADGLSLRWYCNGRLSASCRLPHTVQDQTDRPCGFTVGKMPCGTEQDDTLYPFLGRICDVRIYNTALSARQLMAVSRGLIGHWKLNCFERENGFSDVSGFGNHAAAGTGALPVFDPARTVCGEGSYRFPGGSYLSAGGCLVSDEITVSFLAFREDWGSCPSEEYLLGCTGTRGLRIFGNTGGHWEFQVFTARGEWAEAAFFGPLSPGWHHFACTFDGCTEKVYVDGFPTSSISVCSEKTPVSYEAGSDFLIGTAAAASGAPSSVSFSGNLSDVQICAVALSASGVRDLVQTKFAVDACGRVYAAEFLEEETGLISFCSTGALRAKGFTEESAAAADPDGLTAGEFLEL